MGEGRGIKRKDLIQAQELVIKTGNVNNAKYTKQNQKKKKKGKFANNYSICRGNQLFCLLNTFPFLLRIKESFLTSEYCSPSPSTSPVVPTGATISSTALLHSLPFPGTLFSGPHPYCPHTIPVTEHGEGKDWASNPSPRSCNSQLLPKSHRGY